MKSSNAFKDTIKNYLDTRASEDELFAVTYKKENKNLDECCNYVIECAKKGGCTGYSDEEVFGWAVHYYDEDDIKNVKPIKSRVIVNHAIELTPDDVAAAKQKALEEVIQQEKDRLKKKPSSKKTVVTETVQSELF
ncbi:PcfK-like protein [Flavobacterium cupreum]|uniref:PcfK-like protein n=1 Tax=Flavobacterium cupreum TaxID=2133766 RepID=A0A434A2M7_9FLAO|nr:PcfK-like family protein [Flavobacterium cupreum]RUT68660.1 PcfK-like protein [Flavobacterium cupreum]